MSEYINGIEIIKFNGPCPHTGSDFIIRSSECKDGRFIIQTGNMFTATIQNLNYLGELLNPFSRLFNDSSRVHNVMNHIDSELIEVWEDLHPQARAIAYIKAEEEASNEEWE